MPDNHYPLRYDRQINFLNLDPHQGNPIVSRLKVAQQISAASLRHHFSSKLQSHRAVRISWASCSAPAIN